MSCVNPPSYQREFLLKKEYLGDNTAISLLAIADVSHISFKGFLLPTIHTQRVHAPVEDVSCICMCFLQFGTVSFENEILVESLYLSPVCTCTEFSHFCRYLFFFLNLRVGSFGLALFLHTTANTLSHPSTLWTQRQPRHHREQIRTTHPQR